MSVSLKKVKNNNKINKKSFLWIFFGFFVFFCVSGVNAKEDSHRLTINNDNVINLINAERTSQGIQPLVESDLLNTVAQKKLDNMIEADYFAHTSPEGVDPWEWFFQSGYDFAYAGENLATEFTDAQKQHDAWMNSPKHKKNILDERFTSTGVAVGEQNRNGKKVLVTVQVFATPKKAVMTSPNFTPETFEVPDELFLRANNVANATIGEHIGDAQMLSGADNLITGNVGNFSNGNSNVKTIAWWIIGITTFCIIVVEYRIFVRRSKT